MPVLNATMAGMPSPGTLNWNPHLYCWGASRSNIAPVQDGRHHPKLGLKDIIVGSMHHLPTSTFAHKLATRAR